MFETITIQAEPCRRCSNRQYRPVHVVVGKTGAAVCKSCGLENVVDNEFFQLLTRLHELTPAVNRDEFLLEVA